MRILIVLAVLASVSATAHADRDRRGYVTRALAAVRALGEAGRVKLDRELYNAARARCRAEAETPAAACLIDAARSVCGSDANCLVAADVIATNLRGTNELLDEAARMRILRKSRDYRADLTAELSKRYAVLAAELVMSARAPKMEAGGPAPTAGTDGGAIDELCTRRDREIHACAPDATACIPSLPWSRCVAMLVWFVGDAR